VGEPASVVLQRRVDWVDTDAAGIYHHSTVWRLVEAAEATLHDRLGFRHETFGRTPRARIGAEFRRALYFYDVVDVWLGVRAVGRTSVTYAFELRIDNQVAVGGEVVTVLLDRPRGQLVAWPEPWREQLLHSGQQTPELLAEAQEGGKASPR
jgi:acyl-CoA thioesterase FadM